MTQKEGSNPNMLRKRRLVRLITKLLKEIGDDPTRPGLLETPQRVAKAYAELFRGYKPPDFEVKRFETPYQGLVVRPSIPFQSFCEHHMARYAGVIHFGYVPRRYVIGLSKIIRLIQHCAARLTIQEDLTSFVATQMKTALETDDVAVVISAFHSCESTRGVKVGNVPTVTAELSGRFFRDGNLRDEFYKLIQLEKTQNHV